MTPASILHAVTTPVRVVTSPIRAAAAQVMDVLDGKDAAAPGSASTPSDAAAANAAAGSSPTSAGPGAGAGAATSSVPVSNSATSANVAQAQQSLNGDQQMFLKLLTAQLRNQDPLSPLDANQFTAQLVQMNGVQQQILTNQLLNQLVTNQGGLGNAVGLIGKQVSAATAAATLNGGQATWNYSLAGAASDVTLQVVDSSGNVVWQAEPGAMAAGDQTFTWDGKDLRGGQRADGTTYGLRVIAKTATGETITSTVTLKGVVQSVQNIDGQTVVDIGGTKVPLSLVTSVMSQA